MAPIPTISPLASIREAATVLVEAGRAILAVVTPQAALTGVVTRWDLTRAMAQGLAEAQPLSHITTSEVIAASPDDTILELERKLEHHCHTVLVSTSKTLRLRGCLIPQPDTPTPAR